MSRFRLVIESSLSEVFLISVVVRGVCRQLEVSAADTAALEVCAVEAVTNVIRHAYLGAREHELSVEFAISPGRLDLYVRDEGKSMPDEHAAKLRQGSRVLGFDPRDLRAVPEGGMGLQIIHELMDEAEYSREAGINCLRLTKFLRASEGAEALADAAHSSGAHI
jgi:serine/threonine-protein kinase RsbW